MSIQLVEFFLHHNNQILLQLRWKFQIPFQTGILDIRLSFIAFEQMLGGVADRYSLLHHELGPNHVDKSSCLGQLLLEDLLFSQNAPAFFVRCSELNKQL